MKNILSYLLSPIYWIIFGLLLLIFHPIQIICRWIGGYSLHKKSVDILNILLLYSLIILGVRIRYKGLELIPKDSPLIIVSNHQSIFDIPSVGIAFRKYHPKYVSKKELGKNIPSVSYNLRHGGSVLIDRKNGRQSIIEIAKLGRYIEQKKYSASIFPEGTRSKTGDVNRFQYAGIASLIKSAPSALIVPFIINGNNKLISKGYFPLMFGTRLNYTILQAINPAEWEPKELTEKIEQLIKNELKNRIN
ncbi:lysophospholipid acyltransferase family protein [Bacteroidota bacterium]